MNHKKYFFWSVLIISVMLLSCAGPEQMDVEQVRKTIEEMNGKFTEAVRQGDAAALATLYTENATLMPPDSDMLKGKEAIEEFWNNVMQMGLKDATLTTVEVMGSGNLAYEIGKYTLKMQAEGQEPIGVYGKYVVIWQAQDDGSWKLHVDIWNSSMPPPPPQEP